MQRCDDSGGERKGTLGRVDHLFGWVGGGGR